MRQENSSENTIHYICTSVSCIKRPSSFAAVKIQAWNQLVVMKTACPHRTRMPCARRSPGKKGAFFPGTLARPRPATEAPQRKGKASLALRRASRALALRPLSAAGGRATRGSGKKAFGHPFPQRGGENDLFWHQFSGQSRLKEGLVCPGRCQPSALKKSRFFVLTSEPL